MARTPTSPPAAPVAPPLPQAQAQPMPAQQPQPVAPLPQAAHYQKPKLLEAIAAAWPAFGDIVKDSKNDYLKSSYLSLPGLLQAIKAPLLEQGCTVYSQVMREDGMWFVRTTISFVDGSDEIASDFPITDLSSMQKIGAQITFGQRYNLFALLPVCPAEADDDGNASSYGAASGDGPAALPVLPGGLAAPASWPMPGQHVQAPPAMYPQGAPMAPMPAAPVAYPAQPLPVLQ